MKNSFCHNSYHLLVLLYLIIFPGMTSLVHAHTYEEIIDGGKEHTLLAPLTSERESVTKEPQMIIGADLFSFGSVYEGNMSDVQFYYVSGSNLSSALEIASGDESVLVSLACHGGFSENVEVEPTNGIIDPTRVYVRFFPQQTGAHTTTIAHSTAAATDVELHVEGTATSNQTPQGYYDDIIGTGEDLLTQLHQLIRGHNVVSYSSIWTHFANTDAKFNGKVWDIYSNLPCEEPPYEYTFFEDQDTGTGGNQEGDVYNREHSWPRSWWGGSTSDTMFTDIFHIYPTDKWVNARRDNYPFGEVASPTWVSQNGGRLGNNVYGEGFTGTAFEPIDGYKGDLARTYFYMVARYQSRLEQWAQNNQVEHLIDGSRFPAFEPWAMEMFLQWHHQDPVSQKEINRNNAIYAIQGNRNPFIDHPEYADLIWGETGSNIMRIADAQAQAEEVFTVSLEIENDDPFVAFQADILLPDGFVFQPGSVVLNPERKNGHSVVHNLLEGNILRVLAFSIGNAAFIGNEGEVLSFEVQAPGTQGNYTMSITSPVISSISGVNIVTGTEAGTITISGTTSVTTGSILELRQQTADDGTIYQLDTEAILSHFHPHRNQKYIQDQTAAILIDDPNGIIETTYSLYDGISGLLGQLTIYQGLLQFEPVEDPGPATSTGNTIEPLPATLHTLDESMQSMLIVLEEVVFEEAEGIFQPFTSYAISDPSGTGVLRTPTAAALLDYFNTPLPQQSIKLTAIVSQYGEEMQVFPRSLADMDFYPDPELFTLSLQAIPPEGGLTSGAGEYEEGDPIELTATPAEGWLFLNWKVEEQIVSEESTFVYTMPAQDVTLTAHFELKSWEITVVSNPEEGGNSSGAGIYNHGETAIISALPNTEENYLFEKWTENGVPVSEEPEYSFLVESNRSFTAHFIKEGQFTVSLYREPAEGGTVIGGGGYYAGNEVTISATPAAGYDFLHWESSWLENGQTEHQEYVFLMPEENITFTAFFQLKTFTLTASAAEGGTIEPSGEIAVDYGSDQEFIITPDTGYYISNLLINGEATEPADSFMFTGITEDASIHADFEVLTFTLNYLAGANGSLAGETSQVIPWGEDGSPVEAIADEGYHFTQWSDGITDNPRTDTLVYENLTVTALFEADPVTVYTLIYNAGAGGSLIGDTIQSVEEGQDGTPVEAIPDEGYTFDQWSDGELSNPRIDTNIYDDIAVLAWFVPLTHKLEVQIAGEGFVLVNGEVYHGPMTFDPETIVHLEAIAEQDWIFENWSGDLESFSSVEEIIMDGDKTMVANFSEEPPTPMYNLFINVQPPGAGTVSGAGQYEEGMLVTVTAHPSEGFLFLHWLDELENILSDDEDFIFTMPPNDAEIIAVFHLANMIQDRTNKHITAWPNPAGSLLKLSSPLVMHHLRLISTTGQLRLSEYIHGQEYTLDVSGISNGMYILIVRTETGNHVLRVTIYK